MWWWHRELPQTLEFAEDDVPGVREEGRGAVTGVHLVTYNPERWTWDDYDEAVQRTRAGQPADEGWSVAQRVRGIDIGDWIFLLRQGNGPRGLLGIGKAKSEPYTGEHWDGHGGTAQYIDINWLELFPLDELIPLDVVQRDVPGFSWNQVYSSGRTIPEPSASELLTLWERWTGSETTGVLTDPLYEEGASTSITSRRYERSRAARDACIAAHGWACAVCGALMADLYGDIGRA